MTEESHSRDVRLRVEKEKKEKLNESKMRLMINLQVLVCRDRRTEEKRIGNKKGGEED
jgi:hypothetical protein